MKLVSHWFSLPWIPIALWVTPLVAEEPPVKPIVAPQETHRPVPSLESQEQVVKKIRDILKTEYQKKDLAARIELAKALLQVASDSKDDPAAYYGTLREVVEVAQSAGDLERAFAAIDLMDQQYQVDAFDMKFNALNALSRTAATPQAFESIAQAALGLIDHSVVTDNYDAGVKLAVLAETASRNARKVALNNQAAGRVKEMRDLQSEYVKVKEARQALIQKPDDALASLAVGKFYSFVKNDWEKGLPLLAKGSDEALKSIALKEMAHPSAPADVVALGDAWFDYSEKQQALAKLRSQGRARTFYENVIADLNGLVKVKIEKRLQGLAATPGGALDLLAMTNLVKDTVLGKWKADGHALSCDALPYARIMFPYEAPDEYDFHVEYTRMNLVNTICMILNKNGREFVFEFARPDDLMGFAYIDSKHLDANPTKTVLPFPNGRRYSLVVQVRNGGFKAFVDGKQMIVYVTNYKNVTPHTGWVLPNKLCVGIGTYGCPVVFHTAELMEITGKGKRLR